ncbi:MAG TPA: Crp/Fnr family transcriptional regulator [Pyrinomonadaceae bacterium]|jgi:CRP-like cAMP-binding protein|nr:Crp/Fnr family transcriptional regulator [Pyrinomonadaceae bacterium]
MDELLRSQTNNHILSALPDEDYMRLAPHMEKVDLDRARVIYEIDGPVDYCYFPNNAMVSLVTEMADGKIVEVGLVGKEGMTGVVALMGLPTSPERAIVQIADGGTRVKFSAVKEEFTRGGELHRLLLKYARNLMKQVSQTAACNASHTAEERLSRWLLMCQDRVDGNELGLTQEFIAEMLGTRRATVSLAAMVLQTDGLIQYNRGHIRIIDRAGLEEFTCECYQAARSLN